MVKRAVYPIGVLFFLAAGVSMLFAAGPSSDYDDLEKGNKESLSVPVSGAPAEPVETRKQRRKPVAEKQPAAQKAAPAVKAAPKDAAPEPPRKKAMEEWGKDEDFRKPARISARKAEGYMRQVRAYYNAGDLDEADETLDECLKGDPGNLSAKEFKSKIAILRERMLAVQGNVAEEYYRYAEYFYNKGNIPEALLWIERSVKLNPRSGGAWTLYHAIEKEETNMLLEVNKSDKKELMQGIRLFLKEDFDPAAAIFRKLQRYYPEINDFLSTAIVHSCDAKNSKRSREYIHEALANMKLERYKSAQEDLYLALEMDKTNLYARLVLEQVTLELGTSASPVPAIAVSAPASSTISAPK